MRKRLLLSLGLLAALLGICLLVLHSDEPTWQGKQLSYWMRELNSPRSDYTREEIQQRNQTFTNIVRSLGTNALPYYLQLLKQQCRPSWQDRAAARVRNMTRGLVRLPRRQSVPSGTIKAFEILGPAASPSLPALACLLNDPATSDQAGLCLAAIGREAIPILTNSALNLAHPVEVRATAAQALGNISPPEPAVLPVLYALAHGNHPGMANVAFRALAKAETNSQILLPLLTQRLANTNTAYEAAVVLRHLGEVGLPILQAALTNQQPMRSAAESVLGPVRQKQASGLSTR